MNVPKNRQQLLADFVVLADKHFGGAQCTPDSVLRLLPDLVMAVPKDAFVVTALPENMALLIGPIDYEQAEALINDLWEIHREVPMDTPLQLVVSSGGGEVSAGLAIISTLNEIRRQGRKVHIHVSGWAMSMAFDILQCGADHRSMEPHAFLMVHEEQYAMEGSTSSHKAETDFSVAQEKAILAIVSERTGREVKFYQDKTKNQNWYIGSDVAMQRGLIDEVAIIPPFAMTPDTDGKAPRPVRTRRKKAETDASAE